MKLTNLNTNPWLKISFGILAAVCMCGCKTDAIEKDDSAFLNGKNKQSAGTLAQVHTYVKLFDGGTNDFHSFRIPSLVRSKAGTLIAFAEGRKSWNNDYGDIDVVFKRSTDNGATWSAMNIVVNTGTGTWGNPTAVVDKNSGRIWLFMSWNDQYHNQSGADGYQKITAWDQRRVYSTYSDNDGISWSTPVDRTSTLKPSNFIWDAMGPGVGIQKLHNTHVNRLIIPAIRRNIYSDDGGATWQYQQIDWGTSEGTIVEKTNGGLIRNDRAVQSEWELSKRRRISSGSFEAGFPGWTSDNTLLDPSCQASILRYTDSPNRILFLNSASTISRGKMRVRITYDEGASWPISRRIYDWLTEQQAMDQGKGGYSSMAKTADNMVGALIEINENVGGSATASHRSIEFHKFNLSWILNGATEP